MSRDTGSAPNDDDLTIGGVVDLVDLNIAFTNFGLVGMP